MDAPLPGRGTISSRMALLREIRAKSISVCLGFSRSSTVRGILLGANTQERCDSLPVGQQPALYSANCYAEIHVLSRGWEPLCTKRRRAFEVVVEVDQYYPGRESGGPIVSVDPGLQVRLTAPAEYGAHVDAEIRGQPAHDRLVENPFDGSRNSYVGFAGDQSSANISCSEFAGRV